MEELKPRASRMRALNGFNWLLGAIAACLLVALLVQVAMFAPWKRHDYALTACAPPGFPVQAWITLEDDQGALLKFDTRMPNTTVEHWGEPSVLASGDWQPLPKRIDVHFVSLHERRYYAGNFALPADTIRDAFKRAQNAGKRISISTAEFARPYRKGLTFAACLANDGGVALWLRGMDFQQLLLKARLKPVTPPQGALDFGRPMSLDRFIDDNFHGYDTAEGRAYLRRFDASRDWLDAPTGWPEKNHERERSLQ